MTTQKSYRALQAELDEVLAKLQSADFDIDSALMLYNQAQKLISQLELYLKTAKNNVEHLKK